MTKISALTQDTTPDGDDEVVVQRSATSNFRVSLTNAIRTLIGLEKGSGNNNFVINPAINDIDSTAGVQTLLAAGASGNPNYIGQASGLPTGIDEDPGWSADSGYVSGSPIAASILGGYDQVVNSTGSAILQSNHSMISYGTGGHNTIIGNSYNWIAGAAARSMILNTKVGRIEDGFYNGIINTNTGIISSTSDYNTLLSTRVCTTSGAASYSVAMATESSTISAGTHVVIIGGETNDINGSGENNVIIGGLQNAVSSTGNNGAIIGGQDNEVATGGTGGVILGGIRNTVQDSYAAVLGADALSQVSNSLTIGTAKLNETADAQILTCVQARRTTSAGGIALTSSGGNIDLSDSHTNTGTVKVLLVGMRDGSADANNDADYTQVAYEVDAGFYWDGTNGFLFKSGTETTVTTSPTLDLNLISQTNNDFTPGTTPQLRISTGLLRVFVGGIASTTINWVAKIDLAMTRVS